MKQAVRVDDVNLPLQLRKAGRLTQKTARDERSIPHAGAVTEQVVSQIDKIRFEVETIQRPGRDPVEGQLAELLPEAAARVQEGVVFLGETGQDGGIEWMLLQREVQEPELAYAGVGPGVEGTITLLHRVSHYWPSNKTKSKKASFS